MIVRTDMKHLLALASLWCGLALGQNATVTISANCSSWTTTYNNQNVSLLCNTSTTPTPPPIVNPTPPASCSAANLGGSATQPIVHTRFAPVNGSSYYTFLQDAGTGALYSVVTGPYGATQNTPMTVVISTAACGTPVASGLVNSNTGALLYWTVPGSIYAQLGYPALQPGTAYVITAYQNNGFPPTPANATCAAGNCPYFVEVGGP